MNIAILPDDCHRNFPNLALLKCATWHKRQGDSVEYYSPFKHYDICYHSKVFTFIPQYQYPINADKVVRGGTGWGAPYHNLPDEIEQCQPDYSLAINWKPNWAIGFLTRGCIRRCPWCVVPKAEGKIRPYMDVEQIAIDGRTNLFLMDNNILASDYGLQQIEKIVNHRWRVDFNQAMDARLVTDDMAALLARVRWIEYIRFGCDTAAQVEDCDRAITLLRKHGYTGRVMLYTMLHGDFDECLNRLEHWRHPRYDRKVRCQAQPMLDLTSLVQNIPQWQRDMAHWANQKALYITCAFRDFRPRKGFTCAQYLNKKQNNNK